MPHTHKPVRIEQGVSSCRAINGVTRALIPETTTLRASCFSSRIRPGVTWFARQGAHGRQQRGTPAARSRSTVVAIPYELLEAVEVDDVSTHDSVVVRFDVIHTCVVEALGQDLKVAAIDVDPASLIDVTELCDHVLAPRQGPCGGRPRRDAASLRARLQRVRGHPPSLQNFSPGATMYSRTAHGDV